MNLDDLSVVEKKLGRIPFVSATIRWSTCSKHLNNYISQIIIYIR